MSNNSNTKQTAVIVIDDDPAIRNVIQELLEFQNEYKVFVSSGGKESIEVLKTCRRVGHPCVAVIDLMIPGISGYELIKLIRERIDLKDVRIVSMSASMPKKLPTENFIQKPFSIDDLFDIINKAAK